MFQIQCLESKSETTTNLYSKFSIGPLAKGQGITIGNALRRVLLSNLQGIAITGVRIAGVKHEFSTIQGVKEDIIEILLNLKQIIFKGNLDSGIVARLVCQGPKIVTAKDIELPEDISLVEERQYIVSIASNISLEMEFLIERGEKIKITKILRHFYRFVHDAFFLLIITNFYITTQWKVFA